MIRTVPAFGLAVALLVSICFNVSAQTAGTYPKIDPKNITIVRDSFGIPHIFAKTDAEVAYGLAWANAEDGFNISQDLIYAAKGFMGRKEGIEGAKADYFVHAIAARKLVEEKFDTDLSPEFKKYLDGFCQGLNAYAEAHPDEIFVKKAFPITSKDVITAYVVTMSFLTGAQGPVGDAVGGKYDNEVVQMGPSNILGPVGSNTFAFDHTKTVDGKTYLCINPHLYMDGALSFYEAHLHSDEGLNIEGAMFQGSSSIAMGVNENLGWGMTWNSFDKMDVYKLKMHPKKKLMYEFDGQWIALEKRPVWLKVKLGKGKGIVLPVKKMSYWSKYGATIKSGKSDNYYAVRFPGNMSIKAAEQLYRMNKASNYKEYREALQYHSLALFNIVYADKEDNLYYVSNGMMPDRNPAYNWQKLLPGNTSRTLWTKLVPIDSMPHNENPKTGFLFNTNNSPFRSSFGDCNDDSCRLPEWVDERPGDNNRAERFKEIVASKDKISFEEMKELKFDVAVSKNGTFAKSFAPLFNLDSKKYPDIKEAIDILKSWNRKGDIDQVAPTLFAFVLQGAFDKRHCSDECFVSGIIIDEAELVALLRQGCDTLRAQWGTINVPWGNVNRVIRGNVNMPLRGFPDVLSPSYPFRVEGTNYYKAKYGDTYTMFAAFGPNGVERLEALQPLGNSSKPDSKYYTNQMELFSKLEMRKLSLKKDDVFKKAELIYHPE